MVSGQRDRKRSRERDRTAHAAPAEQQPLRRAEPPRALARAPVEEADEVGDREEPDEARDHDDAGDDERPAEQRHRGETRKALDDRPQLQPNEDEQRRVDDEVEDVPHEEPLQARTRGDDARPAQAHVDPRRHDGEHPRRAELVRWDERRVAGEERDRDAELRVRRALADLRDEPADRQSDGDPTRRTHDQRDDGVAQRERAADGSASGSRDDQHLSRSTQVRKQGHGSIDFTGLNPGLVIFAFAGNACAGVNGIVGARRIVEPPLQ